MKYVDYKAAVWGRLYFDDNTDMNKVIERLKGGDSVNDISEESLGFNKFEFIYDTEEFITPEENDGQSTLEVYEDTHTLLWDNSFEREVDDKLNNNELSSNNN